MNRLFDAFFSAAGLVLLAPLFLVVGFVIMAETGRPVFFTQERVGRGFRPFRIYKFRTMYPGAAHGPLVTIGGDPRVTRVGRYLRALKIDELPQLLNVLKGEMSLVGPRPEVPKYVELYRKEYERLLSLRPGITDPASLVFSAEESLLASSADWEGIYTKNVLPQKIRLSLDYMDRRTLFTDIGLILKTISSGIF